MLELFEQDSNITPKPTKNKTKEALMATQVKENPKEPLGTLNIDIEFENARRKKRFLEMLLAMPGI